MKLKTIVLTLVCSASLLAMETEEENTSISQHNLDVTCLDLSHDESLTDINFIRHFPNLVELNLEENCYLGDNYKPICKIISLTKLNLSGMDITNLKPLKRLLNLQELNLAENQIESVSALTSLKLRTLNLSDNWKIKNLHLISRITTLINLDISGVLADDDDMHQYYPSLDCLNTLTKLKCLNISRTYILDKIFPLKNLPDLEILDIHSCMCIKDYNSINDFPSLKKVIISDYRINPLFTEQLIISPSIEIIFN